MYTICTLIKLYNNTLNLTVTLSLCTYCQYSSAAHCTLSVHSICCTVTYSTLQSVCLSVITISTVQLHTVHYLYTQYAVQYHTQHYNHSVSLYHQSAAIYINSDCLGKLGKENYKCVSFVSFITFCPSIFM